MKLMLHQKISQCTFFIFLNFSILLKEKTLFQQWSVSIWLGPYKKIPEGGWSEEPISYYSVKYTSVIDNEWEKNLHFRK